MLEEGGGRVIAMAAAQRVLYTTPDATRFKARDFLDTVCETAKQIFPQELEIMSKTTVRALICNRSSGGPQGWLSFEERLNAPSSINETTREASKFRRALPRF